jgi:hypothetical protein
MDEKALHAFLTIIAALCFVVLLAGLVASRRFYIEEQQTNRYLREIERQSNQTVVIMLPPPAVSTRHVSHRSRQ